MHSRFAALLVILVLFVVGCRQQEAATPAGDSLTINLEVAPDPPAVGDALMIVTLTDASGAPVTDATVEVRGDTTHPGMVPVIGEESDNVDGRYEIPFEWTMSGDWQVTVTVTRPDGTSVQQEFDFTLTTATSMSDDQHPDEEEDMNSPHNQHGG